MTAPCKDCNDRQLGCHGTCERYKKWKERTMRSDEYKKMCKECQYRNYVNGAVKRMRKRRSSNMVVNMHRK